MKLPIIRPIFATILLGLLSGCATTAGPPPTVSTDFAALFDTQHAGLVPVDGEKNGLADRMPRHVGQQACIVHLDDQGRATLESIGFLKDHAIYAWDVVTLDQVVTCEKSPEHEDELVFKYYKNEILVQMCRMATKSYKEDLRIPRWILLLPEKNLLLVESILQPGMVKFDLTTGTKTEWNITSKITGYPLIRQNPLWDPKKHNLIIAFSDKLPGREVGQTFLARMDLETFSITDKMPVIGHPVIDQLLYYDEAAKAIVCYGEFGGPGVAIDYWGDPGFFEISLETGRVTSLLKTGGTGVIMKFDQGVIIPGAPMASTKYLSVIEQRYIIMSMMEDGGLGPAKDPHTYLIDLKDKGWRVLTGISFVTWPINQDSLHVQTMATPASVKPQN